MLVVRQRFAGATQVLQDVSQVEVGRGERRSQLDRPAVVRQRLLEVGFAIRDSIEYDES